MGLSNGRDRAAPGADRLSARQWALVDVAVAVLARRPVPPRARPADPAAGTPAGPGWAIVRLLAGTTAIASTMFRSRVPGPRARGGRRGRSHR
ncbi:MAG: hypothetical protein ACRDNT_24205 [Streptosporangiaceae bacterium]